MYNVSIGGIRYSISVLFPAVCAWSLYYDESGIVFYSIIAAVFHECGHLSALRFFNVKPSSICISCFGVRFECQCSLPIVKDCIVTLSGPLMNVLLCCVFMNSIPVFAYINSLLAVVNLLPMAPLDGERILRVCLSAMFRPIVAQRVIRIVFILIWITMTGLSLMTNSISLLIICIYIGISSLFQKGN